MTHYRDCGWYSLPSGLQIMPHISCSICMIPSFLCPPPLVREYIRSIDKPFVLGSVVSHRELLKFIDVIDYIGLSEVPLCHTLPVTRRNDSSPGPTANAGDLVWYDPYSRAIIVSVVAHEDSRVVRLYAYDFPTGFFFV